MTASLRSIVCSGAVLAAICGGAFVTPAFAQLRASGVSMNPQRDTLARMLKPVNTEFKETRLEDVVKFLGELTGADIEAMWIDEAHPTGLDKERLISVKSNGLTALKLVERVLEKASDDVSGGNTWQLSDTGAFVIGPKSRLNKDRRVELYDINDLLMVVPEFTNAPQFDLQSVLQSSTGTGGGGGGGGQSPFRDTQQQNQNGQQGGFGVNIRPREERVQELQDIIQQLVEPDQWVDNGGDGGTIRFYQGAFLVNAPDYMHRQINGYHFWPQRLTSISQASGRRYVSFNATTSSNKIDGFSPIPVTAVVGGSPGGGGGGTPPPPPPPPPPR